MLRISAKKSRKYYNRIIALIIIVICTFVVGLSIITYITVQDSVQKKEFETNSMLLNQIRYNMEYMNQMVAYACFSIYRDPDITPLIYGKDIDFSDAIIQTQRLKAKLDEYPFIDSIYIYNSNTSQYYTTMNSVNETDDSLDKTIRSLKKIPNLKPVYRKITSKIGVNTLQKDIFTYFMYEYIAASGGMQGTLIINANANWLIENLVQMNMQKKKNQQKIYVLDSSAALIGDGTDNNDYKSKLRSTVLENINKSNNKNDVQSGYFRGKIVNKELLVTYVKLDKLGWTLLKTQPYEEIFSSINRLKTPFVLITILFIILSIAASFVVTRNIYKPVDRLVRWINRIQTSGIEANSSGDEINFIQSVLENSQNQVMDYRDKIQSQSQSVKNYVLRNILYDSRSPKYNSEQVFMENKIMLNREKHVAVCLLVIDKYKEFQQKYSEQDQNLYKFAIINITNEVLSSKYTNEAIDMNDDIIAIILNLETDSFEEYSKISELIQEARNHVINYFDVSFSASICGFEKGLDEVARLYQEARDNAVYRTIFGTACFITPDMTANNRKNNQMNYDASLCKYMLEEIKAGNLKKAYESLDKILMEISGLNYKYIIVSVIDLLNELKLMVEDINRLKLNPYNFDFKTISWNIFNMETLTEMKTCIEEILKTLDTKSENENLLKHQILVDKIEKIINENYPDTSLCLQQISDQLKLSTKHISRIFIEVKKTTVPEYINNIRMQKAVEFLNNTNLNITNIAAKIGIENESYFYKLFKKRFGVTPREYVLGKTIKN
jgi:AraC-like DNA-binding protein